MVWSKWIELSLLRLDRIERSTAAAAAPSPSSINARIACLNLYTAHCISLITVLAISISNSNPYENKTPNNGFLPSQRPFLFSKEFKKTENNIFTYFSSPQNFL
jgi:hypothetical protein